MIMSKGFQIIPQWQFYFLEIPPQNQISYSSTPPPPLPPKETCINDLFLDYLPHYGMPGRVQPTRGNIANQEVKKAVHACAAFRVDLFDDVIQYQQA